MTDEELKELAKLECTKLLKSEKGYSGLSFQEFWEEGYKKGLAEGKPKWHKVADGDYPPCKKAIIIVSMFLRIEEKLLATITMRNVG